jgi:CTP:molybdopterin cytidylyltransferase MocA
MASSPQGTPQGTVAGILLAAGAGTRMGTPKGLLRTPDGTPWVSRAVAALAAGGCDPIFVVIGASAERVQTLVPALAEIIVATDWREGMGASLRAGLRAAQRRAAAPAGPFRMVAHGSSKQELPAVIAAIITLVDTPGVTPEVVARLAELAGSAGSEVLARAGYDGVPGHPVLIGRSHWVGVIESAAGDTGARSYLASRDVILVEAADVASGADFDTPEDLL